MVVVLICFCSWNLITGVVSRPQELYVWSAIKLLLHLADATYCVIHGTIVYSSKGMISLYYNYQYVLPRMVLYTPMVYLPRTVLIRVMQCVGEKNPRKETAQQTLGNLQFVARGG